MNAGHCGGERELVAHTRCSDCAKFGEREYVVHAHAAVGRTSDHGYNIRKKSPLTSLGWGSLTLAPIILLTQAHYACVRE